MSAGRSLHTDYALTLRSQLPAGAFQQSPQKLGYAALHVTVIMVLCLVLRQAHEWMTYSLAALIIGHSLACVAFVAHEASHGMVLKPGLPCRVFEQIAWGINLIPASLWRTVHNRNHHLHANTLRDPDRRFITSERSAGRSAYALALYPSRRTLRWNPLVFVQFLAYITRQIAAALGASRWSLLPAVPHYPVGQRLTLLAELALILTLQGALYLLVGARMVPYLFAGPIALAVTSSVVMLYVFTNHFLNPILDEPDPLRGSTSVIVPRWLDAMHCNFSYHSEHHVFPNANSAHYPRISELLRREYPAAYQRIRLSEAWRRLWRSEPLARPPAGADALKLLAAMTAQGGPTADRWSALTACFAVLGAAQVPFEPVRAAVGPAISSADSMQGYAFLKPRGYAGDFELLDRIHTGWTSAHPMLQRWDRYFHAQPAVQAVRNRTRYLQGALSAFDGRPCRLLNVAAGPARDVAEILDDNAAIVVDCVDADPKAIEHAKAVCRRHTDRVTFYRQNALRLRLPGRYDLVWSAGLFDYFSDRLFIAALHRLLAHVAPGGELIVGNFNAPAAARYWMESVGDWRLIHRTADALESLSRRAGIEPTRIRIGSEPAGVNLFLHVSHG